MPEVIIDEVLHVADIADEFHIPRRSVRGLIQRGELRGIKAGKRYLVRRSEVTRFLTEGPPA